MKEVVWRDLEDQRNWDSIGVLPPERLYELVRGRVAELNELRLQPASTNSPGQLSKARLEGELWMVFSMLEAYMRSQKIKGPSEVLDLVASYLSSPGFGNARKMMLMLLGTCGGESYGPVVASTLKDKQLVSHAVYSLRLMKNFSYVEEVSALGAGDPKSLLAKEIKRYLELAEKAKAREEAREAKKKESKKPRRK